MMIIKNLKGGERQRGNGWEDEGERALASVLCSGLRTKEEDKQMGKKRRLQRLWWVGRRRAPVMVLCSLWDG